VSVEAMSALRKAITLRAAGIPVDAWRRHDGEAVYTAPGPFNSSQVADLGLYVSQCTSVNAAETISDAN